MAAVTTDCNSLRLSTWPVVALAMACCTTARLAAVTPLTPSALKSARLGALFRLSLLAVPMTRLTCAAKAASSA